MIEIKTKDHHYLEDEHGLKQGEFLMWHKNGQPWAHCFCVDSIKQGECRVWNEDGRLTHHGFFVDDTTVVDFLKEPDKYPINSGDRVMFALKYGSGKFIDSAFDQ